MKRQALSGINANMSRAEQLTQWKEAKAQTVGAKVQASDFKKRPRLAEASPEELKKNVKALKNSIAEKEANIAELQKRIEAQSKTIQSMGEKVSKLEKNRFKMKADCEALNLNIQQLRYVLRKSATDRDEQQETIMALQQRCNEIPALQSFITELTMLNKCLSDCSPPDPVHKTPGTEVQNLIISDRKLAAVWRSEKMALQAEIRALKSNHESLQHRCEELQFNKQLILQQNAELIENAMNYVAKKDEENRSEREAERNELTAAMTSVESELAESLEQSMKKIVELQDEIANLHEQNPETMHDSP